jgi:hypothetical protein
MTYRLMPSFFVALLAITIAACSGARGGSTSAALAGTVAAGGACTTEHDCKAGLDCVKGVCVAEAPEAEDGGAAAAKATGGGAAEVEADGGAEVEHDGGVAEVEADGGVAEVEADGGELTCAAPCPTGQECRKGVCAPAR